MRTMLDNDDQATVTDNHDHRDIFLGRIGRAFGLSGELKFYPYDDFWESVFGSENLMLQTKENGETLERPLSIRNARRHAGDYVISIEGVEDRTAAESFVGGEVVIAEDRIDVRLSEKLLPYQLLGMTVKTESGEVLGTVSAVLYSPAHDIYEITGERRSLLVPAVPEFIVSAEESSRTMVVRYVPGLIEEQARD
jgi:16S rRNA processing protein RimM